MNHIIAKIEKLLALAKDGTNEAESQNALDRAHALLEQHNLSMAEIGLRTGAKEARKDETRGGGLYKWQRAVWEDTAKLNFCAYSCIRGMTKGSKYEQRLIGSTVNIIATRVMAEYLQEAIERIAREWARDLGFNIFAKDVIIFREGMASRISERLSSLRWNREQTEKERQNGQSDGFALTLASVGQMERDLNNDYMRGVEPGTTAQERAERTARIAEHRQRMEEEDLAHEIMMEVDPVYAAKFETSEKKRRKENAAWEAAYAKKTKRAKLRARTSVYRETAEDRRQNSWAFRDGRSRGNDVGLDPQVKATSKPKALT